jgi:hypothetical protein
MLQFISKCVVIMLLFKIDRNYISKNFYFFDRIEFINNNSYVLI